MSPTPFDDDHMRTWTKIYAKSEARDDKVMRSFETGATRDTADGKLDYEGFLSPAVLKQFAKFMNMNRLQSDGKLRDSDNWQKGIPMDVYMKSGYRHFNDWWAGHRYGDSPMIDRKPTMAALCGLLFNVMGYMHEELKRHPEVDFDGDEPTPEMQRRQDVTKFLDITGTPAEVVQTHTIDECQDEQCDQTCEIPVPEKEVDMTGFCMQDFECACIDGCPCEDECFNMVMDTNNIPRGNILPDVCETPGDPEPEKEPEEAMKCTSCRSFDKTWDQWPCSECSENTVDLFNEGPFEHNFFCAREACKGD